MIFLKKLSDLLNMYDNQSCGYKDKAFLYGMCNPTPPLATHIVFAPMPKEVKQSLINNYKRTIPTELLTLYSTMNGADLFWNARIIGKKNTLIPYNCFSIYGVPLTWDREHIEPYNIIIEDLNRPHGTPDSWLKFGSYCTRENIVNRFDLYVDTETNNTFSMEHDNDEYCVVGTWDSIDSCLSFVFDLLIGQ